MRFYEHPRFRQSFALENDRFSRQGRQWAAHEDCPDFAKALEILDEYADQVTPVST